jgi:hypothetical protein
MRTRDRGGDLRVAGARGCRLGVDLLPAGERDAVSRRAGGNDRHYRGVVHLEVAEHVEPLHTERAHELGCRARLLEVVGHQPREGAWPRKRVIARRFTFQVGRIRVREADIGARRAHLEDLVLVCERQRGRGCTGVEVANVGDRFEVLCGLACRVGGVACGPAAGRAVGVIERGDRHRELPGVSAGLVERELLAVDDARCERRVRALQRQV